MADAMLTFDHVTFSYGAAPLIDDLTLGIEGGKVTGIVGPNGCGKSTLMKLAVHLEKPLSGSVRVEGADIAALTGKQRARLVALLAQNLPPATMTVRSLVSCGRYAYQRPLASLSDDDRTIVTEALHEVGISHIASQRVAELSGGQRQRAYLAMVLAQQPRIMLLDEPTSALDIRAAHDILSLVRTVVADHAQTACIVIHDLDLALRYCDRIVVIDRGSIVDQGTPDEIVASGSLERVFDVEIRSSEFDRGRAWTFFPKE